MKIRSHTGNLIEPRVGMKCLTQGLLVLEIVRFEKDDDGDWIVLETGAWVRPDELIMLSCPFMVGDEVEERDNESGAYFPAGKYEDLVRQQSGLYRHSNPDLRSKGEV